MPNVPLPTLGGKQIWADVHIAGEWRIQENVVLGHFRLLGPKNVRHAWGSYEACRQRLEELDTAGRVERTGRHLVLLLHGMFRARESFLPMARSLRSAGYEAVAVTYPSTQRGLEAHAAQVRRLLDGVTGVDTVSLVTHSMGGLVARLVLDQPGPWADRLRVNRLVTIATPHQGARIAELLGQTTLFQRLAGPAGRQLTREVAAALPRPRVPFGIVAGARGDGKGWNPFLTGDDDVTVALNEALLDGAEDVLVVPEVHTFIHQRPQVIEAVQRYLETGRFAEP